MYKRCYYISKEKLQIALLLLAELNHWDSQKFPAEISYIVTGLTLKHLYFVLFYENFKRAS